MLFVIIFGTLSFSITMMLINRASATGLSKVGVMAPNMASGKNGELAPTVFTSNRPSRIPPIKTDPNKYVTYLFNNYVA